MRILFVAADRMEFAGALVAAAEISVGRPKLDLLWAREARLGAHQALLAANGAGAARAATAVDAGCDEYRPEAVVSTGFCGALDPAMAVGDVVVATRVGGEGFDYPALPPRGGGNFHAGVVRSIDHVARTAEEKRELQATGACAVEMEAAGVAARAEARGLPFYCIRVVTDLAGETLANDFNRALRADGQFDTISILASALRRPAVRLPELIRLRKRCALASRILGSFLVRCDF
jgi:adenosylhomocysteine nucleosidase